VLAHGRSNHLAGFVDHQPTRSTRADIYTQKKNSVPPKFR